MANGVHDKLKAFLQWYQDLYGKTWYVDHEIITRVERFPEEQSRSPVQITKPGRISSTSPLQQFNQEIENCPRCRLHKHRTKFVFGVGNENADIMFVGEAPGRDEDLQGEPFVGRAGQLLNNILSHFQLKRSDVYIANILKCRPPNNRDPQPDEVAECIPYLHRQIELIQPKVLVALGRVAAQNLLNNKDPLGKMRKKIWSYWNIPLIVTYHPAAVLRNMGLLDSALDDFRFILKFYQELDK